MEKKFAFILYAILALLLYVSCIVSVATYYAVENAHLVADVSGLITDVDVALDEVSTIKGTLEEFMNGFDMAHIENLILGTEQRIMDTLDIEGVHAQLDEIEADVEEIRANIALLSAIVG